MKDTPAYFPPAAAWLLVTLIVLMPVTTLGRDAGAGPIFYVLALCSLVALAVPSYRSELVASGAWARWRPLAAGALFFILLMLVAQVGHGALADSGTEKTLRFVLLVPLVLLFRRIEPRQLWHIQWGILALALLLALLLIFPPAVDGTRPDTGQYSRYNTVEFGNLTILFATLCFFSCGHSLTRFVRTETCIKAAIGLLAVYGFGLSATRTGWLAVPVFLLIGALMLLRRAWWMRLVAMGIAAVFIALAATTGMGLRDRVQVGIDEYAECQAAPLTDSSICIRMQLARAATNMFKSNPLFGVGGGQKFRDALQAQADQGVISQHVASSFGETHNDLLYYLSCYGLFGLAGAFVFIYLLPAIYLARFFRRTDSAQARLAAAMGLSVCLGFAAFGLAEMMFRSMATASLYATCMAVFLALAAQGGANRPARVHGTT